MYDKHKSDDCHFNVVKCLNKKIYVEFPLFLQHAKTTSMDRTLQPIFILFINFLSTIFIYTSLFSNDRNSLTSGVKVAIILIWKLASLP